MAFIDNPIISSLGSALGLAPLFAAAGGSPDPGGEPAGSGGPPAAPKAAASKPNVPEYKNRPYIPKNEQGTGGVRPGAGGAPTPYTPGTMSPETLQDPKVQSLLGQYGVQAPTTPPDPNLFVHNPAAFQRHPVLSGLLEHGLEGLSHMHPGQNWLDSLGGGVRGIQESNAERAGQVNSQLMAPIQQAQAIQSLQKGADEHQNTQDEIQYKKDYLAHLKTQEETKHERILAHAPYTNPKTGQTFTLDEDESGNPKWTGDPNFKEDPTLAMEHARYRAAAAPLIQKYGSLDAAPPEELEAAYSKLVSDTSLAKGAASIDNNKRTVAARVTAAGMHVGGNVKLSPADAQALKESDEDWKSIDQSSRSQNPITGDDGKMLIPSTAKGKAYFDAKKKEIRDRQSGILRRYGNSAPATQQSAPAPNRNPMTTGPKTNYEPGFSPSVIRDKIIDATD